MLALQKTPLVYTHHYPFEEFDQFVRDSKEKTSVSPPGRHYGHFKVIQKYLPHILKDIHKLMVMCCSPDTVNSNYVDSQRTWATKDTSTSTFTFD